MTSRSTCNQFGSVFANAVGLARAPAGIDLDVTAVGPAQFQQALLEHREANLPLRIVRGDTHEHANAPHPLALLRARRERPRRCPATD
jgi:hypothetical protein